jgi:hypothetical protein
MSENILNLKFGRQEFNLSSFLSTMGQKITHPVANGSIGCGETGEYKMFGVKSLV